MTQVNSHVHILEVVEVIKETDAAVSLVFEIPDALVPRFRYHPGQFLTLEVPSERTGSVARCYSLSSSPHLDDDAIVTVKRTADGYASNWLCDNASVGMRLRVLAPSGVFVPKSLDADLLLLAAGSGITPIMSIAKSALIAGSGTVLLIYANDDADSVIFGAELDEMAVEFPDRFTVVHWLVDERGLPTTTALRDLFTPYPRYDAFLCGPAPFLATCTAALRAIGMPDSHIHHEKFQSLTGDPFADIELPGADAESGTATATVELDGRTLELPWPRTRTLLEVLLANGYDAPFSCRAGECSACACTIRAGEVRMLRNETLVDADLALGLTLACQSVPVSDRVHIDFDQ
ncbi:ferredoxin--NADP reductase [Nocardia lijiangensis]|uniref:ferredoxin--NADP reductase n=1 Tax=Nocardia lijiangensis TaxID=299618 RepID=UPI000833FB66|nr:ferredoxin--NADP reductase [Nocardia lijiangensis]